MAGQPQPFNHIKGPFIPASLQCTTGRFRHSFDYTPNDEIHIDLKSAALLARPSGKKKRGLQHVEGGGSVHQRAQACTGVPCRAQARVCAYMHKVLAVATHQLGFGVHGGYVSRGAGAAVGGSLHAHHVGAHGHLPLHLRNNSGTDILTSKLGFTLHPGAQQSSLAPLFFFFYFLII